MVVPEDKRVDNCAYAYVRITSGGTNISRETKRHLLITEPPEEDFKRQTKQQMLGGSSYERVRAGRSGHESVIRLWSLAGLLANIWPTPP